MLKLLISLTSPYARTARIAVSALDLKAQTDVQLVDHRGHDQTLLSQNPLGKVPTLILEDGAVLYDSRVILECLYQRAGQSDLLYPGSDKFSVMTRQALAAGLMDCTIAAAVERRNHAVECRNDAWIERQETKVFRALGELERSVPQKNVSSIPSADEIFLASALGYLDFMMPGRWRDAHPMLCDWLNEFSGTVASYSETMPPKG